jgi:hypothetical protein
MIIAGLAAILSGIGRDRDYRTSSRDEWRRYGGSRRAIELCVHAAERRASHGAVLADVSRITSIYRVRNGYDIRGELEVYRFYDGYYGDPYDPYGRYGRWGRADRYGRYGRFDSLGRPIYARLARFWCEVRYGEVRRLRVLNLN